jgi:hypothetical protein
MCFGTPKTPYLLNYFVASYHYRSFPLSVIKYFVLQRLRTKAGDPLIPYTATYKVAED